MAVFHCCRWPSFAQQTVSVLCSLLTRSCHCVAAMAWESRRKSFNLKRPIRTASLLPVSPSSTTATTLHRDNNIVETTNKQTNRQTERWQHPSSDNRTDQPNVKRHQRNEQQQKRYDNGNDNDTDTAEQKNAEQWNLETMTTANRNRGSQTETAQQQSTKDEECRVR